MPLFSYRSNSTFGKCTKLYANDLGLLAQSYYFQLALEWQNSINYGWRCKRIQYKRY
jgi:hypothetical protein